MYFCQKSEMEAVENKKKTFVSSKDESVRMFTNPIMDKISRVHFMVPVYLYVPTVLFFLYRSVFTFQVSFFAIVGFLVLGIFLWTFTEYFLHRFLFHFEPKSEIGQRIHFITHGVHHDYPNDSKRLVMVPSISLPLAFIFYFLFVRIVGEAYVCPLFSGFVIGYLFYDLTHYALHHANFKSKFWLELKQHHMYHHYREPDKGFGVSTKFWDHIFRTLFTKDTSKN